MTLEEKINARRESKESITLGDLARQAGQGLSFGFADEAEAGVRSALSDRSYDDIVGGIRDENEQFSENHPMAALAAEAAGGLATGGVGLGRFALKKGAGLVSNLIRGGIGGGVEAGIYGAGKSETNPDDSLADRALQVAGDGAVAIPVGMIAGGLGGAVIGGITNKIARNKQAKEILRTPAQNGQYVPGNGPVPMKPDARVATKQLEDRSPLSPARAFGSDQKVITHKAGKEAVKQGADARTVSIIRNSTDADKVEMRKMLDMKIENLRTGQKNGTPKRVIGESMLKRYKYLNNVRSDAGAKIDDSVSRMGRVDTTQARANFNKRLQTMGAQITPDGGDITFQAGSQLFGQNGQNIVKNALKQARSVGDNPKELHAYKKWLDEQIYNAKGKKATDPLNSNVAEFLDGVRADVNDSLRLASPEYAYLNDVYSEITSQFSELHRLGGKNFDPSSKFSDELLGNLSRRMVSNAQSAGTVREVAEQLTALGNKYDGKFDDDLYNLVEWQVEIDRVLGATPGNSFQSESQQAVEAALRGDTGAILKKGVDAAIKSARNINEEGLIDSLYGLFD